ncbi:hypothetical protein [Bradyrhizobium sp. HKCCYLS3013]|uniref:hypothetical protein n=1 Tax=Bradyrhizobium sp. HKCCYLS3013 TaxID=3420735 RepID=UPI003EBD5E43
MTDESDIARKINRLYELWGYEGANIAATPKVSEAANPDLGAPAEPADPAVSEVSVADLMETWPNGYYRGDDLADDDDDDVEYVDPADPEQVERLRLELKAIDDTAELSQAFLDGCWWRVPELHDEFRRACSDWRGISYQLHRIAGYEFVRGLAKSAAFRGSGPLSTPLQFTSWGPDGTGWDQRIIKLSDLYRHDAVELSACHSFMMH